MNPQRGSSRFIRGRARGGGAYRPYFYFRRNGRTIPAAGAQRGGPSTSKSRGGRVGVGNVGTPTAGLNSSILLPEFYVVPENGLQTTSICIDNPVQCPGWRLYFPSGEFKNYSEVARRIKILEAHYNNHPVQYDLLDIQAKRFFLLLPKVVMADNSITEMWPTLLNDMRFHTETTLNTFGVAMHSVVTMACIDASLSLPACSAGHYYSRNTRLPKIHARPLGFMEVNLVSKICKDNLDHLYCVRGCVSAIGMVKTTRTWVAYKCSRCRQEQALRQQDYYQSRPRNCVRPECHAKDGFIEQRSSPYTQVTPVQIIRLAEDHVQAFDMDAESLEYMNVELNHELVDSVYPGQDIVVTGILKLRPLSDDQQHQQSTSVSARANYEVYLQALSIETGKHIVHTFTNQDLDAITMVNNEPDSFKLLVRSLAPEVHGQEMVKAGVLLSLLGGAGSQLSDESEINVLLVGDPGVGKSSMLRAVSRISERGSLIDGKRSSSSQNQLSATTQGRTNLTLQAGGIISSSNGHCSIDDVDRLASQQETLLQAVLSQSLTLPFTRIFTNLVTSASILATANSARGHYDHSRHLSENIRLHPALLLQFHLVFVLLDTPNNDLDNSLAEHIKAIHAGIKKSSNIAARFELKPKINNSMSLSMVEEVDGDDDEYDLKNRLKLNCVNGHEENELDLLPPILLKKFVAYARQKVKPLLTSEAAEDIKNFYMELRQKDNGICNVLSTSYLEGLIRLSQARSRIDFSSEVTQTHVRDVLCIVRQSLSDTAIGDYVDHNPATSAGRRASGTVGQSGQVKKFIRTLQMRSNALCRRVFDFDELKDMARHAGISCGVTNLVDTVNLQGYLLKKGPNMYEVMDD